MTKVRKCTQLSRQLGLDPRKLLPYRNVILTGAVTEEDSLFTYDYGENHTSYVDVGYIPVFFDQELIFDDVIFGQKARNVCGNNKQCLFDIYTTGKISIGMNSKKALESFVAVVNEIETPG